MWGKTDRTARKTDKSTIIVRDFNTPLSVIDGSSRQKIGKDIVELNSTINQLDLTDMYKILYSTTAEYTFFSEYTFSSHRTLTKTDYILSHKTHLNKFKRTEIIQSMLSYHSEIKLKINNIKIAEKSPNIWRLNSMSK